MQTRLPAVQSGVSHVFRFVCRSPEGHRADKRIANRRYRRYLNALTRNFQHDPDSFDDEPFDAPSSSSWDLW
jgi:hypothetical protein